MAGARVNTGIMLYGYDEAASESILAYLKKLTGKDVIGASATGREKELVSVIIGSPTWEEFVECENKVLMFLGFDNDLLGSAMKHFPPELEKTIFCALTEQNVNWTLEYLIEHLLEERARCSK